MLLPLPEWVAAAISSARSQPAPPEWNAQKSLQETRAGQLSTTHKATFDLYEILMSSLCLP
jgi:hypothetical protein